VIILLGGILVFVAPAANAASPASDAAHLCRLLDEEGVLDDRAIQITRGERVNILMGSASEHSNNVLASFCGAPVAQEFTGTTNKGECIKVLRGQFPTT
jgi:hypothetical protein